MKTLTVYVTREDIKHGKRGSWVGCPIALALERRRNVEYAHVAFASAAILFKGDSTPTNSILPEKARIFINMFDSNARVSPIRFKLTV